MSFTLSFKTCFSNFCSVPNYCRLFLHTPHLWWCGTAWAGVYECSRWQEYSPLYPALLLLCKWDRWSTPSSSCLCLKTCSLLSSTDLSRVVTSRTYSYGLSNRIKCTLSILWLLVIFHLKNEKINERRFNIYIIHSYVNHCKVLIKKFKHKSEEIEIN